MISKLLDTFFGCSHSRYSFPITLRSKSLRRVGSSINGAYVVCLDCGKEFPYDWKQMRVMNSPPQAIVPIPTLAAKQAS
ncbi:MAG: hypothetical protein JOY93_05180 [Acidobacteriales bacterium]|nr:hypothetical protein [Terriglobales bacterium]